MALGTIRRLRSECFIHWIENRRKQYMWDIALLHGCGLVAAHWQLANAKVDDDQRHSTLLLGLPLWHLLEVAVFSDVSLKRWKLDSFGAAHKVAVLHFLSLTFYCTSCFACFVAGKFTSLNLSLMSLKRNFVEEVEGGIMEYWLLPSPRLASDVVGLVVGSGWG